MKLTQRLMAVANLYGEISGIERWVALSHSKVDSSSFAKTGRVKKHPSTPLKVIEIYLGQSQPSTISKLRKISGYLDFAVGRLGYIAILIWTFLLRPDRRLCARRRNHRRCARLDEAPCVARFARRAPSASRHRKRTGSACLRRRLLCDRGFPGRSRIRACRADSETPRGCGLRAPARGDRADRQTSRHRGRAARLLLRPSASRFRVRRRRPAPEIPW